MSHAVDITASQGSFPDGIPICIGYMVVTRDGQFLSRMTVSLRDKHGQVQVVEGNSSQQADGTSVIREVTKKIISFIDHKLTVEDGLTEAIRIQTGRLFQHLEEKAASRCTGAAVTRPGARKKGGS